MEKKFQFGQVVKLKSGGPAMTTQNYYVSQDLLGALSRRPTKPDVETELVYCTWFDGNIRKTDRFHQDLLQLHQS